MKVADVIRRNAAAAGTDLSHVDDVELGARLAAMPLDVADDPDRARAWLVYGHADPHRPLPSVYQRQRRRRRR